MKIWILNDYNGYNLTYNYDWTLNLYFVVGETSSIKLRMVKSKQTLDSFPKHNSSLSQPTAQFIFLGQQCT